MATTPNLLLNKPAFADPGWDVSLNNNFDKIDAILDGGKIITASGAGVVPLTLKGAAGQTADLLKLKDSSDNDLFSVQAGGDTTIRNFADQFLQVALDSGSTAAQIAQLVFRDRASLKWSINKDAANNLNIADSVAGLSRITLAAGGNTIFRIGAGQKFIFEEGVGFNDLFTIEADGDTTIRNFADSALNLTIDCGATAGQICRLQLADQGTLQWSVLKSATNTFDIWQAVTPKPRLQLVVDGNSTYYTGSTIADHVFRSETTARITLHGDSDKISFGSAADIGIKRDNATLLSIRNTSDGIENLRLRSLGINGVTPVEAGTLDFLEIATPANPAADVAKVYVKDNGSGKTQLAVRFATGVEQIIATEP